MNRLMEERDFVNLSEAKQRPFRRKKAPVAIAAIGFVMLLAALDVIPIAGLALIAAMVVVVAGCLDLQEAYDSVEWKILFLIFGTLALGQAMESTGAALMIAEGATHLFGRFGPLVMLSVTYLLASVLTEMISNNAVAVLLTPIALDVAETMGVDGRPFLIALMFGASASFATPIGYQTNTYVYGAGGYRFADFPRVGVPLNILLWLVASLLIPLMWPL
jgi:di/tricarboxylate transporter